MNLITKNLSSTKKMLFNLSTSLIALFLSFLTGAILIYMIGKNPIMVYGELFKGGLGNTVAIVGTLNRMAPILLAGIAITIGNSGGVFNIGFEGQFLFGSVGAVAIGLLYPMPSLLHIPLVLFAGMMMGMLWSIIPMILYFKRNASIIFSCIMLNYVAIYLVDYLIQILPRYESTSNASPKILDSAILPDFSIGNNKISVSVIFALFLTYITYVIMFKTKFGYEMRAVGFNRSASYLSGIKVNPTLFATMLLSSACAGLSGALEISSMTFRLVQNYSPGYLGMGIAVAMLSKRNPVALIIASFLFAAMKNGTILMQMNAGVSQQFIMALQGLIIIFICSDSFFRYIVIKMRNKKEKQKNA